METGVIAASSSSSSTEPIKLHRFPILATLVASFPFFLMGYETAVFAGQLMIQNSLPANKIGNFEAHFKIFIFFSALLSGPALNYIGRKYIYVAGTTLYTVGVATFCLSFGNFMAYKVGRGFMGIGLGFGLVFGPNYIAEISPANYRGFLGMVPQLLQSCGSCLGFVMAYAMSRVPNKHAWRIMIALPCVLSLLISRYVFWWLPESPCFMVIIGDVGSAITLLQHKLRIPKSEVEDRIRQLKATANIDPGIYHNTRHFNRSRKGGIAKMWGQLGKSVDIVIFVAFLHILRVMSGEYIISTHLNETLALNGHNSVTSFFKANLILIAAKFVSSLVPLFLVDRCGRKIWLVISLLVTAIATGIVGVSSLLHQGGQMSDRKAFTVDIYGAILVEVGIGLGIGGIPWLYGPEAFKLPSRAIGVGLAVMVDQMIGCVVDIHGLTVFEYRKTASKMMLLSTVILSVGVIMCLKFMKKTTPRIRVLIDQE